jgi:hypothetical protein
MLHACLYTICFVFCYTSWHFYEFSGTNLLTRWHSASSLFFAVFVFQKRYTENILGIGTNKSWTSYFYQSFAKTEDETKGGHRPTTPKGGAAQALVTPPGVRHLVHLLTPPLRLYILLDGKNLKPDQFSSKHTASHRRRRREIRRI